MRAWRFPSPSSHHVPTHSLPGHWMFAPCLCHGFAQGICPTWNVPLFSKSMQILPFLQLLIQPLPTKSRHFMLSYRHFFSLIMLTITFYLGYYFSQMITDS